MKKVLLLNGSSDPNGCIERAEEEIQTQLMKDGISSDILFIGNSPLADCTDCGYCSSHGECVFKDQVNAVGKKFLSGEYGALVAGSPVYYSGISGRLSSFLDRLFYAYGDAFDGLIGAGVVSCRRGGNTASFQRINQYFLMTNMIVPGSQYWNMVHGFDKEDVEKDLEGLQTMRTLADNIAYLMKLIELGKERGIDKPVREKKREFTCFQDGK